MNRGEEKREKGSYQKEGQLSEAGDLFSRILGVLYDPCNFTAS